VQPQSTTTTASSDPAAFVGRWQSSAAAERANYVLFLSELCDVLGVPRPDPSRGDDHDNAYVFERAVHFDHGDGTHSTGRIDLYKRACLVLEAKQGSAAQVGASLFGDTSSRRRRGTATRGTGAWDEAMERARGQAEQYVRALPAEEGNPPFVVVVDVGHTIELYADFSRLGKTYTPFPDSLSHRIKLADLADEKVRQLLAAVWTDPLSLDPSRRSAKVTRQVAERLAVLARSLEASGHHPETVAHFLMRCIFTFFAEDARLIERQNPDEQPFTQLLRDLKGRPDQFVPMVQDVWARMDAGGFSPALRRKLRHFNGKLFKEWNAIPLDAAQLDLLIDAGASDWSDVEPAIFGTLLERALDDRERHKLGAHFTPRAYVERLVLPTVIEPLREQWDAAKAAAFTFNFQGEPEKARAAVREFLAKLCNTTVLDPACGTGNFLYVTMEHMKRLEGEARDLLRQLGETGLLERGGLTVDPHQFLGLEINPRAVAIAELVLWIGYLKWHLRTLGHAPPEPLLKDFHNIREQDAVLAYDRKELLRDEQGKPVTRWDGRTMKVSPVTGDEVPDESARMPVYKYINPRKAEWPRADFIIGNPPYIGARTIRLSLGDGYLDALRRTYTDVPEHADLVMYWWNLAAEQVSGSHANRFGLITTKSITQSFSRKVTERYLRGSRPLSILFAIPNHPWIDAADGAAVRIAMTVAGAGTKQGAVKRVLTERPTAEGELEVTFDETSGDVQPDLSVGIDLSRMVPLQSNAGLSCVGFQLSGKGFTVAEADLQHLRKNPASHDFVQPLVSARDIVQSPRRLYAIDLFGFRIDLVREMVPEIFQWIKERVKPERDQNNRRSVRDRWWIFGEARSTFRPALQGLLRFFATPITAKHRCFVVLKPRTVCDSTCVMFALSDSFYLGALSSRIHVVWALKMGGRLGVGDDPRYLKADCFDTFPFQECTDAQKQRIRELGEALDAHRKRQQAAHPGVTITDMYNVLEKLRSGDELTAKDKKVHEQGLVSVLKQIHDDLDAAVADAYGWPADLPDEAILRRLVALNAERAEEERRGIVRWLRPEFQNPSGGKPQVQEGLALPAAETAAGKKGAAKPPWPKALPDQARAVRAALASLPTPATADDIATSFKGANRDRINELLATLVSLGQARPAGDGRFAA
jgi:hypothetical protein